MKRMAIVLAIFLLGGVLFAEHAAGTIMVTADFGGGLNRLTSKDDVNENVDFGFLGLSYMAGMGVSYYLFPVLSFTTGAGWHGTTNTIEVGSPDNFDFFMHRGYLRVPLAVHANLLFLYVGGGGAFNFVMFEKYENRGIDGSHEDRNYKSKSYPELFLDVGLDFGVNNIERNMGSRLFIRVARSLGGVTSKTGALDYHLKKDLDSFDFAVVFQITGSVARFPLF